MHILFYLSYQLLDQVNNLSNEANRLNLHMFFKQISHIRVIRMSLSVLAARAQALFTNMATEQREARIEANKQRALKHFGGRVIGAARSAPHEKQPPAGNGFIDKGLRTPNCRPAWSDLRRKMMLRRELRA